MKNKQMWTIVGVGVVAYLWWRYRGKGQETLAQTSGTTNNTSSFKGGLTATTQSCNIIVTDCDRAGTPMKLIPAPDGHGCICPNKF